MKNRLLAVFAAIIALLFAATLFAADLRSNILPKSVVVPKSVSDNTAEVGTIIDRLGYESVTFIIHVGANADNTSLTPSLEQCGAANCSDAAAATALIGTLAGATHASGTNAIYSFGYYGAKRYLRLTLTPGAANTGAIFFSADAILGHKKYAPAQ